MYKLKWTYPLRGYKMHLCFWYRRRIAGCRCVLY